MATITVKYLKTDNGEEVKVYRASKADTVNIDVVYPVGSIYMSTNEVSPASFIGGSWTRIEGKFLLASTGSGTSSATNVQKTATIASGATGGEASHTLSVSEMPSHGNHLYDNGIWVGHGTAGGRYFAYDQMNYFQEAPRGWFQNYGNEIYPAGEYVGGSGSHNNMPPFLSVFVWKRIA